MRGRVVIIVAALSASLVVGGPVGAADAPNDPLWADQYGPGQIDLLPAWDRTTGDDVVVAVIDTGVDLDHEDLAENIIPGVAFVQCGAEGCGDGDWQSPAAHPVGHPHGTHVAGTVAAVADNATGVAGVAPDADILAIRVLGDNGFGTSEDVGLGIRWAADHGADVINMSLGDAPGSQITGMADGGEQFLKDSVAYANSKGVVVVAAAGNDFASLCGTPSWYDGALCVAATRSDEVRSSFSNFTIKPDRITVAAPGGSIVPLDCGESVVSTVPPGTGDPDLAETCGYPSNLAYDEYQGTSMASPHAAGVAALLRAQGCTRAQTIDLMLTTARKPGPAGQIRGQWDAAYGYGIVDANAATTAAADLCVASPNKNQRPTTTPDAAEVTEGDTVTIDVLGNDADPDGDSLRVVSAGGALEGTAQPSADGRGVDYTADREAGATDTILYTVADEDGDVRAGRVDLTIRPGAFPPEPATDLFVVDAGEQRLLDVLANDEDIDGDTLSLVDVGSELATVANDRVDYTAPEDFTGVDSFTYDVTDGRFTETGLVHVIHPGCLADTTYDFESDAQGWQVQVADKGDASAPVGWGRVIDPATQSFAFAADSSGTDAMDARLTSPSHMVSPTTMLTFPHRFSTESGYDGGVLEVSPDGGGTWQDVGAEAFLSGGYNGEIATGFGSAIGGREAWTGSNASYPDPDVVEVDLSAYVGETLQLRLRFVGDPVAVGATPGAGWFVDDVALTSLVGDDCAAVVAGTVVAESSTSWHVLHAYPV